MVRIYQQAEESQIKRLENELDLREIYLLGIRDDNNYVIVRESLAAPSSNYELTKDMSIIEDDSGPIHLSSGAKKISERCEKGEDIVIERLENDLGLQGIYVFGVNEEGNFVIVHRGSKTKEVYVRIFGYGIIVIKGFRDETGRIFDLEINVCG